MNAVIVGDRRRTLVQKKSFEHAQKFSWRFNLNAGELSWNVLLTLHAFGYGSQSLGRVDLSTVDAPEITYVRSNPET